MRKTLGRIPFILILANVFLNEASWISPDYSTARIVLPATSDEEGKIISNDLSFNSGNSASGGRPKRRSDYSEDEDSGDTQEKLYVVIHDNDEEILLQLTPNTHLVTPYTVIEWYMESGEHVVRKMSKNCFYSGKDVRANGPSLVAVSNCDGLTGYIQTNNESYFIEPLTTDLKKKLLQPLRKDNEVNNGNSKSRYLNEKYSQELKRLESQVMDGPRPHVIYKVNTIIDKLNISIRHDQEFEESSESSNQDSNLSNKVAIEINKENLSKKGVSRTFSNWDLDKEELKLSDEFLKNTDANFKDDNSEKDRLEHHDLKSDIDNPHWYTENELNKGTDWENEIESLSEYMDENNNNRNGIGFNEIFRRFDSNESSEMSLPESPFLKRRRRSNADGYKFLKGGRIIPSSDEETDDKIQKGGGGRRKRNGCRRNSRKHFDSDNDDKCLTRKERKAWRQAEKEKKRLERELKKIEREEKKKEKERKRKNKIHKNHRKNNLFKGTEKEEHSSVLDPMENERWQGYSPDLLWDTQVAAGQSGLTEYQFGPKLNATDPQKWLEVTVGIDHTIIDFHGENDVEKYVFTLFNIVSAIYEDPSLEANLRIVLLRLIFYKDKNRSQVKKGLAKKSLESVNRWAERLYSVSPSHLQHDMAVWLTRLDLGGPSGYAPVSGVCEPSRSCTLNRDEGLTSAFIIAHEMGHVLGLSHDGDPNAENDCELEGRLGSVMAPLVAATFGRFHWSSCSKTEYHRVASSWECLLNKPNYDNATLMSSNIKYQYSLDEQCRMEFGEGFGLCRTFGMSDPCTFLWCSNSSTPHLCKTKKGPPLEGTICGDEMWCRHGFCEPIRQRLTNSSSVDSEIDPSGPPVRHNPQHGGWSLWSDWGPCSRTCETGVQFRTRSCDNPVPQWGGRSCEGKREEWKVCETNPCPEPLDLRAVQCHLLSSLVKLGKRRSKLIWLPFEHKKRKKKCRMSCLSPATNEVYLGKEFLFDGTRCSYETSDDICVQGKCISLGCDKVLNSGKKRDECGICGGNGTTCRRSTIEFRDIPPLHDYIDVAVIPEGAWKISIREEHPSSNFLSLRDNSSKIVFNVDGRQEPAREFISEGAQFHYIRRGDKESIAAEGPLLKPVTILVHGGSVREEVWIAASYVTPELERDPFYWKIGALTPCSANCGGGLQHETLQCLDAKVNHPVANHHCSHVTKPALNSYLCNSFKCNVHWLAGPWEFCTATCGNKGFQYRVVSCVKSKKLKEYETSLAAVSQSQEVFAPSLEITENIFNAQDVTERSFSSPDLEDPKKVSYDSVRRARRTVPNFDSRDSVEVESLAEFEEAASESVYNYGIESDKEDHETKYDADKELTTTHSESATSEPELSVDEINKLQEAFNNDAFGRQMNDIDFVDPLLCRAEFQPASQRPCNRISCPAHWKPFGWSECSVTCGTGQQERLYHCVGDRGNDVSYDCGKKPRELRVCFTEECPTNAKTGKCLDQSTFCQLPTLQRYCKIPKYFHLCCETCSKTF